MIHPSLPHWEVILLTGKKLTENMPVFDSVRGVRAIDWSLDLVTTGDILKIKEAYLVFPSPLQGMTVVQRNSNIIARQAFKGDRICIPVTEKNCVFQMKIKSLDGIGSSVGTFECQMLGNVTDKETGACTCYIWDRLMGLVAYTTSIYAFGTWREGIAPISNISHAVVGINLS